MFHQPYPIEEQRRPLFSGILTQDVQEVPCRGQVVCGGGRGEPLGLIQLRLVVALSVQTRRIPKAIHTQERLRIRNIPRSSAILRVIPEAPPLYPRLFRGQGQPATIQISLHSLPIRFLLPFPRKHRNTKLRRVQHRLICLFPLFLQPIMRQQRFVQRITTQLRNVAPRPSMKRPSSALQSHPPSSPQQNFVPPSLPRSMKPPSVIASRRHRRRRHQVLFRRPLNLKSNCLLPHFLFHHRKLRGRSHLQNQSCYLMKSPRKGERSILRVFWHPQPSQQFRRLLVAIMEMRSLLDRRIFPCLHRCIRHLLPA